MANPNLSVHHTAVKQVTGKAGDGWEFHCNDCSFQMEYYPSEDAQEARLKVISLGDVYTRHLSEIVKLQAGPDMEPEAEWLTAEIRQTIKGLVRKIGKQT